MNKKIMMLSTSALGGMLSVIEGYQRDGVFERWAVEFVPTHVEGSRLEKLKALVKALARFIALAARGRLALLHCHVSMGGSFWRKSLFATLARRFRIPVALHLHGSETKEFYRALPSWGKRLVERQLAAADMVFVLSESWRDFVLQVAPEARVAVLPNYVEVPELEKMAPRGGARKNVLFLGLVGKRKGIYDLLPAFAEALRAAPQLFLRIGGNGEVEKAEALARGLGLGPHAEFLGWISGEAKNELLREADIFVLPSYNEGLPVSLLEAMSWGIPVITTNVGGIPELVEDGVNGFMIAPGDTSALRSRLEQLGSDPELGRRLGQAGRLSIQSQFSKDILLPRLESLYAKLTAGPA